ncbi:MAG: hypothetical protein WCP85_27400 [Mariniphaga sp.]
MKRTAKIIRSADDGKRHIAVDTENWNEILEFLKSKNLIKKFDLICQVIFSGFRNSDLYDKEDINDRCKHVTAMKFKGNINARIYCKEVKIKDMTIVIITSELLESKKNQKNKHKEITLIEKVSSYDYEIEE